MAEEINKLGLHELIEKTNLSDDDKKKIAIHEIGHAVLALKTEGKNSVHKLSIVSRGQILGQTKIISPNEYAYFGLTTKENLLNQIKIYYGGLIAEELYLKNISTGSSQDIEQARYICETMVRKFGMVGITNSVSSAMKLRDNISQFKIRKIEKLQDRILRKCYKIAKKIIKKNKKMFMLLYNKLLENNVLFEEDIKELIEK